VLSEGRERPFYVWDLQKVLHTHLTKPSDGLEPSTPSLPDWESDDTPSVACKACLSAKLHSRRRPARQTLFAKRFDSARLCRARHPVATQVDLALATLRLYALASRTQTPVGDEGVAAGSAPSPPPTASSSLRAGVAPSLVWRLALDSL
jgi:hypothetical protein